MFKNKSYNKNQESIVVPKSAEKHDLKTVVKPNVNKNNYENIRNIVENNDKESITIPEIKNIRNKLNIV